MKEHTVRNQGPKSKIRVVVPATSANLGPGFDVLGLALMLHNVFEVSLAETAQIEIEGFGEDMPRDESNLFYRSFAHLYALAGREMPHLRVRMKLQVPPGRGLGSSATAVVGGLLAANALMDLPYTRGTLLAEAVKLEHGNHADNVAPALLGGLVVNAVERGKVISVKVPFPPELKAVLFVPDLEMDTVQGRKLMPAVYRKVDVVFNTSRVALFLAALSQGHYELLRVAMEDKMHQPYRAQIFPLFPSIIAAAVKAGAHGACLSGGGSSVLALATDRLEEIAAAMQGAAESARTYGSSRVLDVDQDGARVSWEAAE